LRATDLSDTPTKELQPGKGGEGQKSLRLEGGGGGGGKGLQRDALLSGLTHQKQGGEGVAWAKKGGQTNFEKV